ncbi:hypothetical protein BBL_2931 [Burkholderia pseudomallei MSHR1328]|nr:hypothetical protein DP57_535 [Burkholderia pseudomallei]KGS44873.1 hypothetical protein X945_577 [Burkholderia pseudomallei ABCPW 107]KGS91097.1 hypothetical protein X942_1590 [Burkholderia pseudomallei MSHR5596]KGV62079.1 hypothetical protein X898_2015 [Burkholderia pseudomallei ABCPW 91]KGW52697.1 hypothetical protein Y042_1008 [Burkholderia pseudomallei MSHR1357]KKC14068.1 hypothetical protein BBL_2931 [Burkholderia pseudomallei MSHR1328]
MCRTGSARNQDPVSECTGMLETLFMVGVVNIFGPKHGHLLAVVSCQTIRVGAARV